jgi:wyosine [tRNA(Phe)-imidazoG37] synthetase (radical SAM superfamily)
MNIERDARLRQYANHSRGWRGNAYIYPVISRRSGGLSIGINLNPDTACNFDCVYCQVDRTGTPRVRDVDVERLKGELAQMIADAASGALFEDPAFIDVPLEQRRIRDFAFSGDGEPTTCRYFRQCVELVAKLKREVGLNDAKIVLITDACYLTKPDVAAGLATMDENNGEIWAKLDAGTEEYYQRVNRPNYPLRHVMKNIIAAARVRPVVIQSLFMQLDGVGPDKAERSAFCDRLNEVTHAGGRIAYVQVYTVARRPAESFVTALSDAEVDQIRDLVHVRTGLRAESYYGAS